jgi:hypothetical protein
MFNDDEGLFLRLSHILIERVFFERLLHFFIYGSMSLVNGRKGQSGQIGLDDVIIKLCSNFVLEIAEWGSTQTDINRFMYGNRCV